MKRETALQKRLDKVSYNLGYLGIPLLMLAGFGIIPWLYFLLFIPAVILILGVLTLFGWKRHRQELFAMELEEALEKHSRIRI